MYCINENTKNITGYISLENITICCRDNETGQIVDFKQATIELFGAATKITYSDGLIDHYFSQDVKDIRKLTDNLFFYHGILISGNKDLFEIFNQYANLVYTQNEYFLSQYKNLSVFSDNDYSDKSISNDINELSGAEFENLCCNLLKKMGFEVETTKASGDGGIDIIAKTHQAFIQGVYIVQCKRYSGSVGEPIIRDLYGVVTSERANKGILITTGTFTKSAKDFAYGKQIELVDGEYLDRLLNEYQVKWENPLSQKAKLHNFLKEEKLYLYKEYSDLEDSLKKQPNDEILRIKLIKLLSKLVYDSFGDIKQADKELLIQETKKHIEYYNKKHDFSNKRTKFVVDVLLSIYVDLSIIEGDFVTAINTYLNLNSRPEMYVHNMEDMYKELSDNMWMLNCLFGTTYNAVQIATLTKDNAFIQKIYKSGEGVINVMREYYDMMKNNQNYYADYNESQMRFGSMMYDIIENATITNCFFINDESILQQVSDYAYLYPESFPYISNPCSIEISDNVLTISGEYGLLAEIDNLDSRIKKLKKYC